MEETPDMTCSGDGVLAPTLPLRYINPFTPELKKCILPTFQKAIVWVM